MSEQKSQDHQVLRFYDWCWIPAQPINIAPLVAIGYDPALSPHRLQVTTGSGIEYAPCISLMKIKALGREYKELPVLCHTLPPSTGVDGLLGLNFFRGLCLTINFRKGEIEIS